MEIFTKDDLITAFREVGVGKGDIIFVHSRLYGLGKPENIKNKEQLCRFFLDTILEVLGQEGTLVVPTLTTQVARNDELFDVDNTASNYGLFPEYVFKQKDFVRSKHPLASVAACGALKEEICLTNGKSNYGARSPYDNLVKFSAKNVFIGVEPKKYITMVHYIEMHYGVPYQYNKILKWRPIEKGVTGEKPYFSSSRYLEYNIKYKFDRYHNDLFDSGVIKTTSVGGGFIYAVSIEDLLRVGYDGLEKDPYYFLEGPPDFDYGKIPFDGPSLQREKLHDPEILTDELVQSKIDLKLNNSFPLAPQFVNIVRSIFEKSSLPVKKTIGEHLIRKDDLFFNEAENLVDALVKSNEKRGGSKVQVAGSYLKFRDNQREQTEQHLDENNNEMGAYLDGKLLNLVLSENNWKLLRFSRNNFFAPYCLGSKLHLEICPGHGWFTLLSFRFGVSQVIAYDVSDQAIKHVTLLLENQEILRERCLLKNQDVWSRIPLEDQAVSTAMAGEVLKRPQDSNKLLEEIYRVLKPGGVAFISTVIYSSTADLSYRYLSTDEIRDAIRRALFEIEQEIEIDFSQIDDESIINYGAVLRKKGFK